MTSVILDWEMMKRILEYRLEMMRHGPFGMNYVGRIFVTYYLKPKTRNGKTLGNDEKK